MEKSEAKWNAEECSAEVFAESHVVSLSCSARGGCWWVKEDGDVLCGVWRVFFFVDLFRILTMDDNTDDSLGGGLLPHELQTPLLFAVIIMAMIILPQLFCPFNTYKAKDD